MIIITLLLLLLSNSITLRRDKSILYSRVTITILVISTLITYDDLNFLFLSKDIGIFGGLYSCFIYSRLSVQVTYFLTLIGYNSIFGYFKSVILLTHRKIS